MNSDTPKPKYCQMDSRPTKSVVWGYVHRSRKSLMFNSISLTQNQKGSIWQRFVLCLVALGNTVPRCYILYIPYIGQQIPLFYRVRGSKTLHFCRTGVSDTQIESSEGFSDRNSHKTRVSRGTLHPRGSRTLAPERHQTDPEKVAKWTRFCPL